MWQKILDGQYRRPSGLLGRWIGAKMLRQHRPENLWTVDLLMLEPGDHVLEVGFGPGLAIREAARRVTSGRVAGVDFSAVMVRTAQRRNAAAHRSGRVDLHQADAAELPFADSTFDKAYSIHSIYFWPDPLKALRELHRVLKPGGLLVLTILPKEKWNPSNPDAAGTPECTPYAGSELIDLLTQSGFKEPRIEADSDPSYPSNYSVLSRS